MSQGLVIVFSPKGNDSKKFTRIFGGDGSVFFPNPDVKSTDAEGIKRAAEAYRVEYKSATKNIGTVHKCVTVEIPDDLLKVGKAFNEAMESYQNAKGAARNQEAIALTQAFADLNDRIRTLSENVWKAK